MTWFFIALLGPLFWLVANFVDKYTIEKFISKETDSGMLVLFTSLSGLLFLPIVYFFTDTPLTLPLNVIGISFSVGIIYIVAFIFYCRALQVDDTSNVTIFFQLAPVYLYILGFFFLGENISLIKITGGILIAVGSLFFTFNIHTKKFKKKLVINMLFSSILTAVALFLYKFITVDNLSFFDTLFWELWGFVFCGIVLGICIPKYRTGFLSFLNTKNTNKKIIFLSLGSELLSTLGIITTHYATLLAPLFYVSLVNSFQPLLTLFVGFLITKSGSLFIKEKIDKKTIFFKLCGVSLLISGIILFFSTKM